MQDFTILIDNREKLPWTFDSVRASGKPVRLEVSRTATADYSLKGGTDLIAIERKSLVDFQKTMELALDLTGNRKRDRFEREIARMQSVQRSYIIVEAPLARVLQAGQAIKGRLAKISQIDKIYLDVRTSDGGKIMQEIPTAEAVAPPKPWSNDGEGYNFLWAIKPQAFPPGKTIFQFTIFSDGIASRVSFIVLL